MSIRSSIGIVLLAGLLFAASEVGLRLLTDTDSRWNMRLGADKQFDPIVQFRNKPHNEVAPGVVTNALGYRAPEPLSKKPAEGVLRLIFLGDSNTVIPFSDPYPLQLEGLLESELSRDVEIVNAAVPGYSSENARKLFESELSDFDADYFFIYLGWNDLGQFGPEGLPYKRVQAGYPISPLQRVLSNIYTLRFTYAIGPILERRRPASNEPLDEREAALYANYEATHFEDNLNAIIARAKVRYPHVRIMNLASLTSEDPTDDELRRAHFPRGMGKNMRKLDLLVNKYNAVVERVARAQGIPLIDLRSAFDDPEARRHFTDSCHMDAEGAGRIAQTLAREVLATEAIGSEIHAGRM